MSYTAESISVLKGLEPVRHRPGMYTRTDCPLHIIQEAIDNAADEALGGYCKRIAVMLHGDGSVTDHCFPGDGHHHDEKSTSHRVAHESFRIDRDAG